MEYRSLRAAFQSNPEFIASVPETNSSLLTVMDQALFFAHHLIDINIQLQQLFLEITRNLVDSSNDLLLYLQQVIKRAELLKLQLATRQSEYASFLANESSSHQKLFSRFYGRVGQKLFKKFLYFSLNRRELGFSLDNLLELFDLNEEIRATEGLANFDQYWKAMGVVTDENFQLINLILQAIIKQGYVSSVEEFAGLMGIRFRSNENDEYSKNIFHQLLVSNLPSIEDSQKQEWENPLKCQLKQKRRAEGKKRQGQVFHADFKKQLEVILSKYQHRESRISFMEGLSREIQKQLSLNNKHGDIQTLPNRKARKKVQESLPTSTGSRPSRERKHRNSVDMLGKRIFEDQLEQDDDEEYEERELASKGTEKKFDVMVAPPITKISYGDAPIPIHNENGIIARGTIGVLGNFTLNCELADRRPSTTIGNRSVGKQPGTKFIACPREYRSRRVRRDKRADAGTRQQFRKLFDRMLDNRHVELQDKPLMVVSRGIDRLVEQFQGQLESAVSSVMGSKKKIELGPKKNKQNTKLIIGEIQNRLANRSRTGHCHRPTLITEVTNKISKELSYCKSASQPLLVRSLNGTLIKARESASPLNSSSPVNGYPDSANQFMNKQDEHRRQGLRTAGSELRTRELYHTHLRRLYVKW